MDYYNFYDHLTDERKDDNKQEFNLNWQAQRYTNIFVLNDFIYICSPVGVGIFNKATGDFLHLIKLYYPKAIYIEKGAGYILIDDKYTTDKKCINKAGIFVLE